MRRMRRKKGKLKAKWMMKKQVREREGERDKSKEERKIKFVISTLKIKGNMETHKKRLIISTT